MGSMEQKISIGNQNFEYMREHGNFYIDKTKFIKEWWESEDIVTLITRPRRFGKTLNLSMMESFFSINYAKRSDLFEGLSIWEDEKYQKLQGTYPVILLSFASVKGTTYESTKEAIITILQKLYKKHSYLLEGNALSDIEKRNYNTLGQYIEQEKTL